MNTDQADPHDLQALREALNIDGGESALGWDAVHSFEAKHGIVVPEPYRSFVAEISGLRSGLRRGAWAGWKLGCSEGRRARRIWP